MAAAVAAVPAAAVGQDPQFDSVTGGGEVALGAFEPAGGGVGPGDTITFTALQRPDDASEFGPFAAEGEVQWIDRDATVRSRDQRVHGKVVCLRVEADRAVVLYRPGNAPVTEVNQLYIFENEERGDDLIVHDRGADVPCAFSLPVNPLSLELARGEVQIHDAE